MTKADLGIYVHFPFCARKCDYCDFVSMVGSPDEQAYYIRVLKKEIRSFEALENLYLVRTVFFGGGTPSIMDTVQLERVMEQLREQYEFAEDAEITIECNPGTLTEEKLQRYREMGINRLSIGLQSTHNEELKVLGRIHSYEDFLESYRLARKVGFQNINVDLMSGLPGQSVEAWDDVLRTVVALNPEHVSAYSLSIEEGTPFYERYASTKGRLLLPKEKEERDMYHMTKEILEEAGYHRYEISNYAKKGRECRHNMIYWTGGEYVGFGLGAYSYLGGRRFGNPRNKQEYWESARSAYQNYKATPPQTEKATMEEFMFLGLRMMRGVSTREFEEKFHVPFQEVYGEPVRKMLAQGFLEEDGSWIRFTDKGIDVSNRLLVDFLL